MTSTAPVLPAIDGRAVIDGRRSDAADGRTLGNTSPGTGADLGPLSLCGPADVDRAVSGAAAAFESGRWSGADAAERKRVLLDLADRIDAATDELAMLESMDMGKPVHEARAVDVPGAAATFRWYAELVDKLTDEVPATPPGSTAVVSRRPLGVVGAIVPWNYPLEIAAWKLAPALAVGNSVVLKPAELSSLTALRLGDLALEAGLPAGVLNVVTGTGAITGDALARHRRVDALTFTGSTATAQRLMVATGETGLKRLSLEAGGKSANIVFADTDDLAAAAAKAAFGAFYNQGEVCSANSTILVERPVYDQFLALFVAEAAAYEPGDPFDAASGMGALVSAAHADSVQRAIQSGADSGEIVHGGERMSITGSTAYLRPTVITGLDQDHPLHQHEIFGPVVTVTPFDTEDEAIRRANSTSFGLAASVWTSGFARAHRVSARLVAGTVSVNTVDALGLTTPFGGFKQSGFGRDLSAHAIDNYVGLKTTWFQHG
ncbi:aldehyde dehydrogenase family protein [Cryobacterium sp.]|jgi:gamma-glutamyl-gamma-aminobutyraldehyde dehydrogenase|uniref:aldehyde dehydrogenase family protein n=1 Tax=Cryobacterium sp. TaxID=1926290 RepID=UPI00261E7A66|nr:aldehyde dehydrogenase family protein [Cryobacterium sp.]MCU1444506.1 aldehyde dehydrogenase [Cryobacterium sp.]